MTLNELFWDGITIQGHVRVLMLDEYDGNRDMCVYDGDGEGIAMREDDTVNWMNMDILYIYPSKLEADTICIELETVVS